MNTGAPHCPKDLTLQNLIQNTSDTGDETMEEINNALRYLYNHLTARKGYQRKMQIKRKVLTRMASEQGWDKEIDDAVAAQFPNLMEAASLDDLEDTDER